MKLLMDGLIEVEIGGATMRVPTGAGRAKIQHTRVGVSMRSAPRVARRRCMRNSGRAYAFPLSRTQRYSPISIVAGFPP